MFVCCNGIYSITWTERELNKLAAAVKAKILQHCSFTSARTWIIKVFTIPNFISSSVPVYTSALFLMLYL